MRRQQSSRAPACESAPRIRPCTSRESCGRNCPLITKDRWYPPTNQPWGSTMQPLAALCAAILLQKKPPPGCSASWV